MSEQEWLAGLNAGDEVAISGSYRTSHYSFGTIDRLTKTQFVVGKRRFRRANGKLVGAHGYGAPYLVEPTDKLKARMLVAVNRDFLGFPRAWLRKLSDADANRIAADIKKCMTIDTAIELLGGGE